METEEKRIDMTYNSLRSKLVIPEYGRHVQNMLIYAKTIEKDEDRQAFVEFVVNLMEQMQTSSKPSHELTEKLWNHVFMIAGYDLAVTPPDDVVIVRHTEDPHPPKLEYPEKNMNFRHYGFNVQQLIDKADKMEDPEKKAQFANVIASYMKLAYKTWNHDHYVNDEVIKGDLKAISHGTLDIPEEQPLDFLTYNFPKQPMRKKRTSGGPKHKKNSRHKRKR